MVFLNANVIKIINQMEIHVFSVLLQLHGTLQGVFAIAQTKINISMEQHASNVELIKYSTQLLNYANVYPHFCLIQRQDSAYAQATFHLIA